MGYTVQSGDSLWKIAKTQCGAKTNAEIQAKINEIAQMNNIANPNLIFTGSTLKLPGDTFEPANTQNDATAGNNEPAAATTGEPQAKTAAWTTETSAPQANFTITNLKLFEDFENWRLQYKDAMQAYKDTLDQGKLDEATLVLGKGFNFNSDNNLEENLKSIANGMFKSLNDGKGVTYDAFLNWYTQGITTSEKAILRQDEGRFREAFDKLDADNNSLLDASEMEKMFKAFDKMDKYIDGIITNQSLTNPYQFTAGNFTNV